MKLDSLSADLRLLISQLLPCGVKSLMKKGLKGNLQSFPREGDVFYWASKHWQEMARGIRK